MNTKPLKYDVSESDLKSEHMDSSSLVSVDLGKKYFGFYIASTPFLLDTEIFCEVVVDPKYAVMPNAPSFFLGLQNLRGHLIPIYKLHDFLDEVNSRVKQILFIGRGDSAFGICIDSLPIIVNYVESDEGQESISPTNDFLDEVVDYLLLIDGVKWNILKHRELGDYLLRMVK